MMDAPFSVDAVREIVTDVRRLNAKSWPNHEAIDCHEESSEDERCDALGEIANMPIGIVRARVPEPTSTSLPVVCPGRNLQSRLQNVNKVHETEWVCEVTPVAISVWKAPHLTMRFNRLKEGS
ncbi:MAG: hypothetical protein GWP91_13820 [Rhodobacterales bacterium]|nr:hypothetical protein [Rhodobacterales bacterium]